MLPPEILRVAAEPGKQVIRFIRMGEGKRKKRFLEWRLEIPDTGDGILRR